MSITLNPPRIIRLFDLDVHAETLEETASRCIALAQAQAHRSRRRPALIFSMNPEKAVQSIGDPAVRQLLQEATLLIPDGVGICLASRLLAGERMHRVPGSDLMPRLCALAEQAGLSVYLYGASPSSNTAAVENIKKRWPKLQIAGASDGFRPPGTAAGDGDGDTCTVAADIASVKPDIVFVGLGSPRQERWMAEVGVALPVGLMQGVGGTIDIMSGQVARAPSGWQALGLEWFYRLLQNPSRWRRQLALVEFLGLVIRRWLHNSLPMKQAS